MTTPSPIQDAPRPTQTSPTTTPYHVFDGLLTHSRTKKLQQKMYALLCETHYNISENYILPNLCALLLVKFAKEDDMNTQRVDYMEGPRSNKYSMTEPSERISHNF
jgi:hypothetical protein